MSSRLPARSIPFILAAAILPIISCSLFQTQGLKTNTRIPQTVASLAPPTSESPTLTTPFQPSPTDTGIPTATKSLPTATSTFAEMDLSFTKVFSENFESYPFGVLGDAPDSAWVRKEIGRVGNVTKYWVYEGGRNLQVNSFMYNTEIDYIRLELSQKPAQINLSLWYTPDGYFIYTDFAEFGFGYTSSKFELESKFGVHAVNHEVLVSKGISGETVLFNELEYSRGPADMGVGTPKHNYVRLECDFVNNVIRFYIGPDENAPLRATRSFDGQGEINAFYVAGGLNPTFFDDILIEAGN